jgi:hypothetical protein
VDETGVSTVAESPQDAVLLRALANELHGLDLGRIADTHRVQRRKQTLQEIGNRRPQGLEVDIVTDVEIGAEIGAETGVESRVAAEIKTKVGCVVCRKLCPVIGWDWLFSGPIFVIRVGGESRDFTG